MKRLLVVVLFLIAATGQAGLPVLQLQDYIEKLDSIRTLVRAGNTSAARTEAEQLLDAQVTSSAGTFVADSALLHEVMASPQSAEPHLTATINALRDSGATSATANVDPRLINRLRAEESPSELRRGGEIDLAPAGDEKTFEKAGNWVSKAWEWIGRQWDKLANWFDKWWPKSSFAKEKKPRGSARGIVIVVVAAILIVIAILAYEVIRRSRRAVPKAVVASDPIASKRDDDPLSRGATEWERYAAQLAAAGRIREAIRAWYHAVLVTLYAAGILHFRKGRTNWEYVSALSPELAWRSEFVTLTRRFEEEWYGRERSSIEALENVSGHAREILDTVRGRAAA